MKMVSHKSLEYHLARRDAKIQYRTKAARFVESSEMNISIFSSVVRLFSSSPSFVFVKFTCNSWGSRSVFNALNNLDHNSFYTSIEAFRTKYRPGTIRIASMRFSLIVFFFCSHFLVLFIVELISFFLHCRRCISNAIMKICRLSKLSLGKENEMHKHFSFCFCKWWFLWLLHHNVV